MARISGGKIEVKIISEMEKKENVLRKKWCQASLRDTNVLFLLMTQQLIEKCNLNSDYCTSFGEKAEKWNL